MTTSDNTDVRSTLEILDAEPLEVRNASLSHEIDKAFSGFLPHLTSLAWDQRGKQDWDDVNHYIEFEEGERDLAAYQALCFMYACFILCVEGEEDSF
jgi:hypothetical protein